MKAFLGQFFSFSFASLFLCSLVRHLSNSLFGHSLQHTHHNHLLAFGDKPFQHASVNDGYPLRGIEIMRFSPCDHEFHRFCIEAQMFGYLLRLNAQSESESNRDVAFLRRDVDNSCHFENKQLNLTTTMVYQEPKEEEMRSLTGKHGAKDCHGCVCNLVVTFSAHAELAEALPELHTLVRS